MDKKKKLEEAGYEFPERINILLTVKDGKLGAVFTKFKNKKINLDNIKVESTQALFLDGTSAVSLGVYDFESYEDFDKKLEELSARWIKSND